MKNTPEIVNEYIIKNLDKEFNRIQQYDYIDLKLVPSENLCKREWESLVNTDRQWSYSNIIRRFHISMCFANRKNMLCPYDGWNKIKGDKTLFEKLLRNRLTYNETLIRHGIPDEIPLHIYSQGMNIMKLFPSVSYFKPSLAKYLIVKYLDDAKNIYDPFSGYSGRMLGALACKKNYYGTDLCDIFVDETNNIYSWLKMSYDVPDAYVEAGDSEVINSDTFDTLFTCPPYDDIENWPGVNSNIHTCDEWIDICISNNKCRKYLFVVDDKITKWKSHIVETIENKSHFVTNNEFVILI